MDFYLLLVSLGSVGSGLEWIGDMAGYSPKRTFGNFRAFCKSRIDREFYFSPGRGNKGQIGVADVHVWYITVATDAGLSAALVLADHDFEHGFVTVSPGMRQQGEPDKSRGNRPERMVDPGPGPRHSAGTPVGDRLPRLAIRR